jgi:hypothetical protein
MTVPLAQEIVGGPLGQTGKMPGPSWGISATECQRGATLASVPDSICSRCYANRYRYLTGSVRTSHNRRLAALDHPRWVEAMAFLIHCYANDGPFRWFDSGDLQSPQHLAMIVDVCRKTPRVAHWLPTKEPVMIRAYLDADGSFPPNLCIRISADLIEDRPTTPTWGLPTSTVHRYRGEPVPAASGKRKESIECRAHARGGACGPCRACWDPRVRNVSYPLK